MLKTRKPKLITRTLLVLSVAAISAVLCSAQDDAAYAGWMKTVNASVGATRTAIAAKDNTAVTAEANKIAASFDQIVDFWTARKVDDAIKFAQTARDAAKTLAAASDTEAQNAALMTLRGTCGQCHTAHRESVGPGQFKIK